MRPTSIYASIVLTAALALPGSLAAQGKEGYLNLEPPTNKALAHVRIDGRALLLVANSPDDSVEIYDSATQAFVARVPVGLNPIGVRVKPTPVEGLGTLCYSINWSGDSVTAFALNPGNPGLNVRVLRTVRVGDEPTDLAFLPAVEGTEPTQPGQRFHEAVVLIHGTPGNWDILDPVSLLPFNPLQLGLEMLSPSKQFALKEPWAVEFVPGTPSGQLPLMVVLNKRGGNSASYDFDIWGPADPGAIGTLATVGQLGSAPRIGGLGSAHFAMEFADNGDLYVVGQLARNNEANMLSTVDLSVLTPGTVGEGAHRGMEQNATGFVRSMFWRISNLGTGTQTVESRDLNQPGGGPLPITQPTALAVRGDGSPGTRIFVAGFNSDTLGMLEVTAAGFNVAPLSNWALTRIDASHPTATAFPSVNAQTGDMEGVMMGPRALVLNDDPGSPRLFIYNRVDHSVRVLNAAFTPPSNPYVGFFGLRNNPEPGYIQDGRKFLYSSALSANGTSSCASCHVDGDTDQLAWNLGEPNVPGCAPQLLPFALPAAAAVEFKGPMVTQSLRGLPTFEVSALHSEFTTDPLHWRGDKGRFTDFNAAYMNLMGLNNAQFSTVAVPCDPNQNKGVTDEGMRRFQDFVFSVHYPPNPEQPLERVYSGSFGTPNSTQDGSEAQRGLKLFHENPVLRCAFCHTLPSGSNPQITDSFFHLRDPTAPANPLETAALRGLVRKEKRLSRRNGPGLTAIGTSPTPFQNTFPNPPALGAATGEFGLLHTGENTLGELKGSVVPTQNVTESIQAFLHSVDFNSVGLDMRDAIALYIREFDTGVAPVVGFSGTVDPPLLAAVPGPVNSSIDLLEGQVRRANAELAVHAFVDGLLRGFWFDVSVSPPVYVEEPNAAFPNPGPPLSRAALFAFIGAGSNPQNTVTFHSVPLGAGRRIAWLDGGQPPPVIGNGATPAPALASARPNTANVDIPSLPRTFSFGFATVKELQFAAFHVGLATETSGLFGVKPLGNPPRSHHEAPRRFRVSGPNIQHGARLVLFFPSAIQAGPSRPSSFPGPNNVRLEFPIYPTQPTDQSPIVWETAVEADAVFLYSLLCGSPISPGVTSVLSTPTLANAVSQFATHPPLHWNWYFVLVFNTVTVNGNTTTVGGTGGWQRLTL